ncbi:MAG: hypothetical protein KDG56_16345, partial [Ottowia sp.]|nr:hypothetical protein [Ottowia sp.]
ATKPMPISSTTGSRDERTGWSSDMDAPDYRRRPGHGLFMVELAFRPGRASAASYQIRSSLNTRPGRLTLPRPALAPERR